MASRKGYCFLLSAVICILTATTFAGRCPSADLNGNCWVNIYDLEIFASQWLNAESCEETAVCADFDGMNGIDFADSQCWQASGKHTAACFSSTSLWLPTIVQAASTTHMVTTMTGLKFTILATHRLIWLECI